MANVQNPGEQIRRFILSRVEEHPGDIAGLVSRHFGISRQAVHRHLRRLLEDRALVAEGTTRNKRYRLRTFGKWSRIYELRDSPVEDAVWNRDIRPRIGQLPANATDIWQYGFTEMFNNAIEHSGGDRVKVFFEKNAAAIRVAVADNGVGIFKKIQAQLGLADERHATLELAKGKFTTDPENHTGEGIFFASRAFDKFTIGSGQVYFSHASGESKNWIPGRNRSAAGTLVWMQLNNHAPLPLSKLFDRFTSGDDYGFTKTIIPVRLAQYGDDKLVSRSQAKRVLMRLERFKTVIFDFSEVESIGQAFADEIFRVFARRHPQTELTATGANRDIQRMIRRARSPT